MSPVPILDVQVQPSNGESSQTPQKSQKQMTKAERRELQERQRAAKATKTTSVSNGTNGKLGNKPASQPSSSNVAPKKAGKGIETVTKPSASATSKAVKDSKIASTSNTDATGDKARGIRIFSHFGLPKPASVSKGDIHPTIIRLALQFSNFKITGANARCIATLTAFKTVRVQASVLNVDI